MTGLGIGLGLPDVEETAAVEAQLLFLVADDDVALTADDDSQLEAD